MTELREKQAEAERSRPPGSTVDRALTVVVQILEESGEPALRLADVSRRSGVSVGSLYHHFGSREGLVRAARERQLLASMSDSEGAEATQLLKSASSEREFLERLTAALQKSDGPTFRAARRRRFEMIAAVAGKQGHLGKIVPLPPNYLEAGKAIAASLRERGILREEVDPSAFALFLHTISMGRVLQELVESDVDAESWQRLACLSVAGLLTRGHVAD